MASRVGIHGTPKTQDSSSGRPVTLLSLLVVQGAAKLGTILRIINRNHPPSVPDQPKYKNVMAA